jgi:phosphoribosylformimino-5-aminoimidazole carboxamide ribotide isomerase
MNTPFVLYPAIDLRDGNVVRLEQGDFTREQVYDRDPVRIARGFADDGATWLHVVDLDAAVGRGDNRDVVRSIAVAMRGQLRVQVGGGVRSVEDAQRLADAGVARVVMGSAAVRDPQLVDAVAGVVEVAVGLDHRNGEVAVEGWLKGSTLTTHVAVGDYPAANAFIVTDISRDGMLAGPDVEGLRDLVSRTATPIIASGGVSSLGDLRELREVHGLAGAIVGKALYEGRFSVREAVQVLQ